MLIITECFHIQNSLLPLLVSVSDFVCIIASGRGPPLFQSSSTPLRVRPVSARCVRSNKRDALVKRTFSYPGPALMMFERVQPCFAGGLPGLGNTRADHPSGPQPHQHYQHRLLPASRLAESQKGSFSCSAVSTRQEAVKSTGPTVRVCFRVQDAAVRGRCFRNYLGPLPPECSSPWFAVCCRCLACT